MKKGRKERKGRSLPLQEKKKLSGLNFWPDPE